VLGESSLLEFQECVHGRLLAHLVDGAEMLLDVTRTLEGR
jgi:hypothetical protein